MWSLNWLVKVRGVVTVFGGPLGQHFCSINPPFRTLQFFIDVDGSFSDFKSFAVPGHAFLCIAATVGDLVENPVPTRGYNGCTLPKCRGWFRCHLRVPFRHSGEQSTFE